jgi:hypothetical protein
VVLEKLFAGLVSLPFDDAAAWHYANIRHQLETAGCVIGPNDLKIAAICRASGLTIVTSNTAEFPVFRICRLRTGRIPGNSTVPGTFSISWNIFHLFLLPDMAPSSNIICIAA